MWEKERDKKQVKSVIGSQIITGMPFGSGKSDKVADVAVDIADTDLIIRGKLAEIQQQRKKIIEYIDSIDDSLMRQIIFYRHVSCMTWQEVADSIGGKNTENSVKKAYSRFMKEQERKAKE